MGIGYSIYINRITNDSNRIAKRQRVAKMIMTIYKHLVIPVLFVLAFVSCGLHNSKLAVVTTAYALRDSDKKCAQMALENKDVEKAKRCSNAFKQAKSHLTSAIKSDYDKCHIAHAIAYTLIVASEISMPSKEMLDTMEALKSLGFECQE